MKVIILLSLVAVSFAAPQQFQQQSQQRQNPILQEEIIDLPEPYAFNLNVADDESTNYQSRSESQDENGVVTGEYSYVGPDGIRYTHKYTADPINGYQVQVIKEDTGIQIIIPEPQPQFQQPAQQLQQSQQSPQDLQQRFF